MSGDELVALSERGPLDVDERRESRPKAPPSAGVQRDRGGAGAGGQTKAAATGARGGLSRFCSASCSSRSA